jgi:hypothetical protein
MHEVSDHLLSQTRVRTGRTDLCTLEARFDALGELDLIKSTQVLRVGLQHLRDTRHCDLPSIADPIPPANQPVASKESLQSPAAAVRCCTWVRHIVHLVGGADEVGRSIAITAATSDASQSTRYWWGASHSATHRRKGPPSETSK